MPHKKAIPYACERAWAYWLSKSTVCCGPQAFVYKYYGQRNARQFAPHALREAVPGERVGPVSGGFLQLEGLGKIAYSNVRRPKPLMDVSDEAVEVCSTR